MITAIIDIGSASFKYDMRRLTEILAFPKAWYRRSIVRRLFLGDFTTTAVYSEEDSSPDQDIDVWVPTETVMFNESSLEPSRTSGEFYWPIFINVDQKLFYNLSLKESGAQFVIRAMEFAV